PPPRALACLRRAPGRRTAPSRGVAGNRRDRRALALGTGRRLPGARRAAPRAAPRQLRGAAVRARHLQRRHHDRARGGVVRGPHRRGARLTAARPQQRGRPGLPAVRRRLERAHARAAVAPMIASDLLARALDSFASPLVPTVVALGVALILLLLEGRLERQGGAIDPYAVVPPRR